MYLDIRSVAIFLGIHPSPPLPSSPVLLSAVTPECNNALAPLISPRRAQAPGPGGAGRERPRHGDRFLDSLPGREEGRPAPLRGHQAGLRQAHLADRGGVPVQQQVHRHQHHGRHAVPLPRLRKERHGPVKALRVGHVGGGQEERWV